MSTLPTPVLTESSVSAPAGKAGGAKTVALIVLAVLNAALVLSLVGRQVAPNSAHAAQAGRISEYVIIPSRPIGLNQDVLYILDTDTASIAVAGYDPSAGPNGRIDFRGPMLLREGLNRRP